MKSKIISIVTAFTMLSIFSIGIALPIHAAPINNICDANVDDNIKAASGCGGNIGEIDNAIINVINAIMGIVAAVAVIAIVIGGIQYMTSVGDPGKVKRAKDTILYAVIGLVIVILAAVIVNVVINSINGNATQKPIGSRTPTSVTKKA